MAPPDQAKVLRDLAARIESGHGKLTAELEDALVRQLEDLVDLEAVETTRGEPTVPWEQTKRDMGL